MGFSFVDHFIARTYPCEILYEQWNHASLAGRWEKKFNLRKQVMSKAYDIGAPKVYFILT